MRIFSACIYSHVRFHGDFYFIRCGRTLRALDSNRNKKMTSWCQSKTTVNLSIFEKNLSAGDVIIKLGERQSLTIYAERQPEPKSWTFQLYDSVTSINCEVTPYKIELTLTKAVPAEWPTLVVEKQLPTAAVDQKQPPTAAENKKPKNWDEWAAAEDKTNPYVPEGANALFQQCYAQGDEASRRAMNKSYVESNGTVLSTNWNEVEHANYSAAKSAPLRGSTPPLRGSTSETSVE